MRSNDGEGKPGTVNPPHSDKLRIRDRPKVGDHFTLGGYEGVVTRTARRRVTEVRLSLTPAQDEDKDKDKDKRFSRLPQRTESR